MKIWLVFNLGDTERILFVHKKERDRLTDFCWLSDETHVQNALSVALFIEHVFKFAIRGLSVRILNLSDAGREERVHR